MKKYFIMIFAIILFFILALLLISYGKKIKETEKPVVKISATIPLTGNLSETGHDLQKAITMAKYEIFPNSKYRYEFIIEDDAYNYKKTALNTINFINLKRTDAILSLYDGAGGVIAPIAEKNKTLHINCGWGEKIYKENKYTFNHFSKTKTQVDAFIKNLKKMNVKTMSIVSVNYASINELFKYLNVEAEKNGIEILSKKLVNFGTRDFRLDIAKIKQENPDIVMVLMLNPELDIFGKQAMENELNIPYTSIDLLFGSANMQLFEGADFVFSARGGEEFEFKFNKKNFDTCVPRFYDSVKLIVNAYEKLGDGKTKPSIDEIIANLHKIKDYPSAIGVNISVDESGIIDSKLKRAVIKNGEIEVLESVL
jgi:ABC-type branched-subunit amino acid transport system substrate-binding protein